MAGDEPEKGDKVSWQWGGGAPGGTVADKKKEGEIAITSKRGNKIKKNAEPSDPAVHVERSGNDVVKKASELNVEKKGSGSKEGSGKDSGDKKEEGKKNEKRKADDGEAANDNKSDPLVKNSEGKEVKPGGKSASKKQKQEKEKEEKTTKKEQPKKDGSKKDDKKKEEEKPEEKEAVAEKRKPGRPKGSGEGKKDKSNPTPRQEGDLVSSRTRSQRK